MHLWHLTPDTPRIPVRVSAGEWVVLVLGTWPIEAGQDVWVTTRVAHADGEATEVHTPAAWVRNEGENSYWQAEIGPFVDGDRVSYSIHGRSPAGSINGPAATLEVGPKLHLALLWHQHQPLYKNLSAPSPVGSYALPWVRLHAIRDYYPMAALVAEHPQVHLTINLTPVLLWQIEDYTERGATDRALELTRTPAESLGDEQRLEILSTFFDANRDNQILPQARYQELFERHALSATLDAQDMRDLQMWFNLAWFGKEFRERDVELITGEVVGVRRFVERQRGFTTRDIDAMVADQYKILRAIIPLHRTLQERAQVELSTTPFFHPILPLLVDTDRATIDRAGATYPPRFAYPEDAEAQVRLAVAHYEHCFGRRPRGMWPAEGAVSRSTVSLFASAGVEWIATDQGVLARSGRWGYRAEDPDVLCQPYRAMEPSPEGVSEISVFFREPWLANHVGFHYQNEEVYEDAARAFLKAIKERYAWRVRGSPSGELPGGDDRVLCVALDGENAWGAYREDARPFLHALYGLLERDTEVRTVTFAEYLDGNPMRRVRRHPTSGQRPVHDLYTGSWIDEMGSAQGVDLGTWVGEAEENRAWEILGRVRADLAVAHVAGATSREAMFALYAAEGSDWFWWHGEDQDSGMDEQFDALFRGHLRAVYENLRRAAPAELSHPIIPRTVLWTPSRPVGRVHAGDRLLVRVPCAGVVVWQVDADDARSELLTPTGGVMAGTPHYQATLGPVPSGAKVVRFSLRYDDRECERRGEHRTDHEYLVQVAAHRDPVAR